MEHERHGSPSQLSWIHWSWAESWELTMKVQIPSHWWNCSVSQRFTWSVFPTAECDGVLGPPLNVLFCVSGRWGDGLWLPHCSRWYWWSMMVVFLWISPLLLTSQSWLFHQSQLFMEVMLCWVLPSTVSQQREGKEWGEGRRVLKEEFKSLSPGPWGTA